MGFSKRLIRGVFTAVALGVYIYFGLNDHVKGILGGGFWGEVAGIFVAWMLGGLAGWAVTRNME